MALFPAFAGLAGIKDDKDDKELGWLTNQSFCSEEALSLHQRALEKTSQDQKDQAEPSGQLTSEEEEEEEEGRNNVLSKKRKKKKKEKKKKKKKDSDTVYPSDLRKAKEAEPSQEPTPAQTPAQLEGSFSWLDDLQSPPPRPFILDRKKDPANWEYKSLYRGDIARYRRKGVSSLGLDPRRQALSWAESDDRKRSDRNRKPKTERYFSSSARPLLRAPPTPSLPPGGAGPAPGTPSFIPLPPEGAEDGARGASGSAPGAGVTWVNPLGVYDDSTALWLQGRGQEEKGRGQDPSRDGEGGARDGEGVAAPLLADRVEDFNRRLRETPTDTQLWLQFLTFQDELWEAGGAGSFPGSEGEAGGGGGGGGGRSFRASLERKLCIAERAVEMNPGCVALQLERLRLSKELWEPNRLQREWRKLVFLHPHSAPLWREYLLFTQSHFSAFTVTRTHAAYGRSLSTLSAVQDGTMTSHPVLPGTEESMLDIFIQQVHFLRQAGHSEKAVCLFQALLDFTFFKPDSVKDLTTRQQVEFFEPFWDSGEPRVGERGARGWKAWMLQQERGGWLLPNADEDEEDEDEDQEAELKDRTWPRWRIWLDVETSREASHWLPWRPDKAKGQSEEDCEDPDRQVLFDDISSSLIRVVSPDLQLRLVLSFLQFLGLPAGPVGAPESSAQSSLLLEDLSVLGEEEEEEGEEGEGEEPKPTLTAYLLPTPPLVPVGHMTTLRGGARKWAGLGRQGEEFVSEALQMLLPSFPSEHREELYLSWLRYEKLKVLRCVRHGNRKRLRAQGRRSKRQAKRLLREPENRGRLALWTEYAHLEWLLGNRADARKVFDTALLGGAGTGTGVAGGGLSDPALCQLCLLYAQLEVEEGASSGATAVYILTKLAEGGGGGAYTAFSGEPAPPVAVLKARRAYEIALDARLTGLEREQGDRGQDTAGPQPSPVGGLVGGPVGGLVGCYALFQYLTVGVEAAEAVYGAARERLGKLRLRASAQANGDASQASKADANSDASSASSQEEAWLAAECKSLCVQRAALLRHHTSACVFPLRPLREALTSALALHPSSAPLWRLYARTENRYHSAGRARRFYSRVARGNASVVPRLFAIGAEQRRKRQLDSFLRSGSHGDALPALPETGLSNRIRSLFESALATPQGAHCPLLWRMYMHFLVSEGNVEKAKGIFYKALQDVPWAKGVYMDAVRLFPDCVQEFLDLMTEKELRLRLPMEEMDILLED